jgi:ribose transport system permease protein/AI-2 transport system permease protein
MLGGMRGWLTGLEPVFGLFTRGDLFGIPIPIFLLGIIYFIFWYIMTNTSVGRHIYAVGNSEEAANLAGISTDRIILLSFSVLGALVGFTALIYVGRLASVEITVGQDLPLSAIAATVIGGTSVKGGKGSVVGTLAGVLFIAIMKNGVVLLGIPSLWEKAVVGFLIIVSVIIDLLISKRLERRKREQLADQKKESMA